jgi:hypothetical protein
MLAICYFGKRGNCYMTTQIASEPMADDKAKTLSVKLHMDVIESARIVAAIRNISMTDMLSDMLRPDLVRMEREELAKRAAATAPKPTSRPESARSGRIRD